MEAVPSSSSSDERLNRAEGLLVVEVSPAPPRSRICLARVAATGSAARRCVKGGLGLL